ncbi:hypothetical protein GCM10022243_49190 [Saccharothrix violaceirubra]|uniref:DNA-binding phage zinc finger domain-containing protein n=1 Tax=Saccharothrix violaceirubra TaxID=413306 RepID=A0A7W7WUF7_9PSEU|nr:hypothetical protein [Saccharothrix violaceirubra]MBB4963737.1 hypothetical protein [Saccharothrix violaceirubra]
MNLSEAGRILATAISLDPKMPQPDAKGFIRGVWQKALHDVPYEDAEKAVFAHYRSDEYTRHRETISPADIVQWWNARRRPTERERSGSTGARAIPAAPFDPERLHAGVDRAVAALRAGKRVRAGSALAVAEREGVRESTARRRVLARPCGYCRAQVGEACVDGRGRKLTKSEAHPSRLVGAEVTPRARRLW